MFKGGATFIDLPKDSSKLKVFDNLKNHGKILVLPHRAINGIIFDLVEARIVSEKLQEILKEYDEHAI